MGAGVPIEEIVGRPLILRRAMMFEAEAVDAIRQREKKVIVIIVLRAEQARCLRHQRLVRRDLLRFGHELIRAIGEQI